jgi:hypothetical protein
MAASTIRLRYAACVPSVPTLCLPHPLAGESTEDCVLFVSVVEHLQLVLQYGAKVGEVHLTAVPVR